MIDMITSQIIPLQGAVCSMQGGRPENQDDWGVLDTPLGFLLIVCDGMGGGPGGKTASYMVKNMIATILQSCNPQTPRMDALKMAISKANDALYQKMDETPSLRGMGSTMVAVLVNSQSVVVAHLGDSRCYRISHGRVAFRTDDHSLVGELVRNKAMTEEQARVSPQSNVITRGLGNTSNHVPELAEIPYRKGDRFVLCTDGVWGAMPHEQLVERLTSQQDIQSLVSHLSAEIDQRGIAAGGNHDNHTLAVIEMKTDSLLKDKMSKQLKIMFGVLVAFLAISLVFNFLCVIKLGALSKITELEKENKELKSNMTLYQNVKNDGTRELITKVEVLEYEKELLSQSQDELIEKIDSLEKVIAVLQKHEQASTVSTSTDAKSKQNEPTPQELAQRVVNQFKAMEDYKGNSWPEVTKKKAEYRNKIIALLLMLNKKTEGKFSSTIDGVNRELRHVDPLTDKVCLNTANKIKEEYVSTGPAKKKMQELSKKIQDIKIKM